MLIRWPELKVRLEVHLGALLQHMSCNKTIHVQLLLLLGLLALLQDGLLGVLREVFEFELLFLSESTII